MKKITLVLLVFCLGLLNGKAQETTQSNKIKDTEVNYTIKNLEINSKYQDYGVSYSGGNTVIFASSRKDRSIRNRVWKGNDQPFLELYKGTFDDSGEIVDIKRFSKKVNSKFHDADVTFTKDLKTIYFTRNNFLKEKFKKDTLGWNLNQLYKATINANEKWEVQQMPFNNDNYQTGHPVLNAKEDKLYFISDMLGGYGKTDIYVVDILSDTTYSKPRNLGPNVNTQGKEMFPFIDSKNILYFSSNGYIDGNGGLDIYVTRIKNDKPVKKSENIGRPINSEKDDFAFVRKKGTRIGYFSSNRPGGKGDDDIYSFIEQDCFQLVQGVVTNRKTGDSIPGALVELFDQDNLLIESVITDEYAAFKFKVNCKTPYKVVGSKQDYTIDTKDITTSNVHDLELALGLMIQPSDFVTIRGLLMVNINPIYFDLDKSNIRENAAIEIEKVVRIMKKYPEVIIELGSYTDSRAPDEYNLDLSERRVKSSIEWIIERGIDPLRITGQGYGETQLVNKCSNGVECSEAEHQLNRRTEFVIVNPEVIK